MMQFSDDPQVAENQMQAIIYYLTAFGYIDGDFAPSERAFVRQFIARIIEERVSGAQGIDPAQRSTLIAEYTGHFYGVFSVIDEGIKALFDEAVADNEDTHEFVYSKIKLRAFELFKGFDEENQQQLFDTVRELVNADGVAHPNEVKFCEELTALLKSEIPLEEADLEQMAPPDLKLTPAAPTAPPRVENHPFFERVERHYSRNPEVIREQAAADYQLMEAMIAKLDEQRARGEGKLLGRNSVAELAAQEPFLDGHVYVLPAKPGREYEIIVLGDLHGCYSCLKAALMQSDFFAKVQAFKNDPQHHPDVKLVLLGDYIDRGVFSYTGILRAAMQLFVSAPEHVYVLRGNHEYYLQYRGKILGGVKPAEAILTHEGYLPPEMFEMYKRLFDSLPNLLFFDRFLFVHAGIPRDDTLAEKYTDLASLNDPDMLFQMMWSDPSETDFIPAELQKKNARFPFGRLQFRSFMARVGANTMVRGHEKVDAGFKKVYDDGVAVLLNLFSSGGKDNNDLPIDSSYRKVTPMALTIKHKDGQNTATPWLIDYARYQSPEKNAFFKAPMEIQFRSDH
jgi:hypothetical protein